MKNNKTIIKQTFPLVWNPAIERGKIKRKSRCSQTWIQTIAKLESITTRANLKELTISSNMVDGKLQGFETGVAVQFTHRNKATHIMCDRYLRVTDNLIEITKLIDAYVIIQLSWAKKTIEV